MRCAACGLIVQPERGWCLSSCTEHVYHLRCNPFPAELTTNASTERLDAERNNPTDSLRADSAGGPAKGNLTNDSSSGFKGADVTAHAASASRDADFASCVHVVCPLSDTVVPAGTYTQRTDATAADQHRDVQSLDCCALGPATTNRQLVMSCNQEPCGVCQERHKTIVCFRKVVQQCTDHLKADPANVSVALLLDKYMNWPHNIRNPHWIMWAKMELAQLVLLDPCVHVNDDNTVCYYLMDAVHALSEQVPRDGRLYNVEDFESHVNLHDLRVALRDPKVCKKYCLVYKDGRIRKATRYGCCSKSNLVEVLKYLYPQGVEDSTLYVEHDDVAEWLGDTRVFLRMQGNRPGSRYVFFYVPPRFSEIAQVVHRILGPSCAIFFEALLDRSPCIVQNVLPNVDYNTVMHYVIDLRRSHFIVSKAWSVGASEVIAVNYKHIRKHYKNAFDVDFDAATVEEAMFTDRPLAIKPAHHKPTGCLLLKVPAPRHQSHTRPLARRRRGKLWGTRKRRR